MGTRINKYFSERGICSRREADRLLAEGRVELIRAGERIPAKEGMRVEEGDLVLFDGAALPSEKEEPVYLLYHKPRGLVCTHDQNEKDRIFARISCDGYLTYAGRLDKDSSGLLLLTNDGALLNELTSAGNRHEKEYECTVDRPINDAFLTAMRTGVEIELPDKEEGRKAVTTRPCRVIRNGQTSFTIILTQGFNRQIRRMCDALGYRIRTIKRTRIANLLLGDLPEGEIRRVTENELKRLQAILKEDET